MTKKLRRKYRRYKYRWIYRITLALFFVGAGTVSFVGYKWYHEMPKLATVFKSSKNTNLFDAQVNIKYLDSDGKFFYQSNDNVFKEMNSSDVKNSKNVVHALLAIEDRDFYNESGVNYKRTLKAGIDTIFTDRVVGGSTITQQLIKLAFFSTDKKDQTIKRKYQEMILAEQLNSKYSKDQILAWYLNKVNFANGQHGLIQASKYYYDKEPDKLSVLESATLIGIVNSPAQYNPYTNPKRSQNRRNEVLYSMYQAGYISKSRFNKLSKKSITDGMVLAKTNVLSELKSRDDKLLYNGYISAVNAQLSRYDSELLNHSVTIKTSMNRGLQDKLNNLVEAYKYPDDKLQSAVVVLDNRTGDVIAMSGGRKQTVLGGYNRVFNVKRSSGSTIKPLLDFAPGMDLYHWNPDKKFDDSTYFYPNSNIEVKDWDRKHQGNISMKQALVQSRNIPAVKALVDVNLTNGRKVLNSLGLPSESLYYANAIGLDVSPLSLASAYSSLANNGVRSNAKFIDFVEYKDSKLNASTVHENVYSQQTAYLMNMMLKGVFESSESGSASDVKIDGINVAGKTGTIGRSNDDSGILTDSWMVGYTKSHTVCVWVGYDDPYDTTYQLDNDKAKVARELFKSTMLDVKDVSDFDGSDWEVPSGVSNNKFDKNVDTTSNDFLNVNNCKYSNLPFYVDILPQQLLGNDVNDSLDSLYKKVNG